MKKTKKVPKEDPSNTWNMQFMAAVKAGNRDDLDALLEKGAEVDHVVKEGDGEDERINTPFTQRMRQSDHDMMRLLIDKYNCNLNQRIENEQTSLHYAVYHDMSDVIELLMEYPQVDTKLVDGSGQTAMQAAIAKAKVDIALLLLKGGAYHDFRDRSGGNHTQTQLACIHGDVTLLETLLELGESVHQEDMEGNSLLHLAALNERRNVVETLLGRHCNLESSNALGLTPVWVCMMAAKWEEAAFLVAKGATPNTCNSSGMPLLHFAVTNGNHEMVLKALEFGADPTIKDVNGNTALHWACCRTSLKMVDTILDAKTQSQDRSAVAQSIDINAINFEGCTALHKAATWGRATITQYLLAKEADSNIQTKDGKTALHFAAAKGHQGVATELLVYDPTTVCKPVQDKQQKKGAPKKGKKEEEKEEEKGLKPTDTNVLDANNQTALQLAMINNHTSLAELLISHSANVQKSSPQHGTLLHHAVAVGNLQNVVALMTGGADVNAERETDKRTPLHVAAERGLFEIVKYLIERGVNKDAQDQDDSTALHLCVQGGHYEIAHYLVTECEANVALVDKYQQTALHVCATVGAPKISDLLLQNEADPNCVEMYGRTPLHVACEQKHPDVVQVLIQHTCDIEARDNNNWAPLHVAVHSGCTQCTTLLIEAGAELNLPNNTNNTPLMLASQAGQVECARILVIAFKAKSTARAVGEGA
eukprot:TRINITY_DN53305_c0_g1_i1.p1 TRINITY_DN53305_c0_g1~~TRINITY_DN53305_c0_g1_i1.p1  ORF type:complete len:707 (-),score=66.43 TRINITY_DN53305_c0_g1_i1:85-2205(-)